LRDDLYSMFMKRFLLALNWQLFLLVALLPLLILVGGLLVPAYYFSGATLFFAVPLAVVFSQVVLYGWMWSVGQGLYRQKGLQAYFSNKTFRWMVATPVFIILLVLIFWLWGAAILGMGKFSMANVLTGALLFLLPLEVIFIVSKFYCLYFVARVLKTAELQRAARFEDFSMEFILLMVFPIGLWWIQPRVNRLADKK